MRHPANMNVYELRAEVTELRAEVTDNQKYIEKLEIAFVRATSFKSLTKCEIQQYVRMLREQREKL